VRIKHRGVLAVSAALAALAIGVFAYSASAAAGTDPAPNPKSQSPAGVNPNKQPELTQPFGPQKAEKPAPPAEQLKWAKAKKARDPGSTLICYAADGSVAGVAIVDKVDKDAPIADAAGICDRGWRGSHP
jgi:hypothetical protein